MSELSIPDLLMRFSPTPFGWTISYLGRTTQIESNDLEIALALKRALDGQCGEDLARMVGYIRLVVDRGVGYGGTGPRHDQGLLQLGNGPMRTLFHGAGTVLFYDSDRRELLGFLGQDVTPNDLLERFVPSLLEDAPTWFECAESEQ